LRNMAPPGFAGLGHAEQRRDHGDAPAPLELARNRQPARGTHERTVDENERRLPRCRSHRCSMPSCRWRPVMPRPVGMPQPPLAAPASRRERPCASGSGSAAPTTRSGGDRLVRPLEAFTSTVVQARRRRLRLPWWPVRVPPRLLQADMRRRCQRGACPPREIRRAVVACRRRDERRRWRC
jgi:hypothetical protein